MIPGLKDLNYEERLKELGIWSLEERKNQADLLEVFKMNSGLSAISFQEFFEVDKQQKTQGHSWKIHKQRCHLDVRKYFFSDRVVNRWNKLDQDIVDCESVNGFKNRLEKWREMKMGFFYGLPVSPPSLEASLDLEFS